MTVLSRNNTQNQSRQRRPHAKSRSGCGNCKLRRIKCDESKPSCKKCLAFGVPCNTSADLQLFVEDAFTVGFPQKPLGSQAQMVISMINDFQLLVDSDTSWTSLNRPFDELDFQLLDEFQNRTVFTLGTERSGTALHHRMIAAGFTHRYLMHMMLASTLVHRRFELLDSKASVPETYHRYQANVRFNQKLSGPIKQDDRDALVSSAILFGSLVFCGIEANTPEEAWPLTQASPLDLSWLRLSKGKIDFYRMTETADEAASGFTDAAAQDFLHASTSILSGNFENLPKQLVQLCQLRLRSSADTNPYYTAASIMSHVLPLRCTRATIMEFMCFLLHMEPPFTQLLKQKDPAALLLLCYWYAKICQYRQWWILKRAVLECEAICIYLERYHEHEIDCLTLLRLPRESVKACYTASSSSSLISSMLSG